MGRIRGRRDEGRRPHARMRPGASGLGGSAGAAAPTPPAPRHAGPTRRGSGPLLTTQDTLTAAASAWRVRAQTRRAVRAPLIRQNPCGYLPGVRVGPTGTATITVVESTHHPQEAV
jgi:hypothetical protein